MTIILINNNCLLLLQNTNYVFDKHPRWTTYYLHILDFSLAIVILLQFLPRIWLAREPLRYIFTFYPVLTFVSTVPVIIAFVYALHNNQVRHTYMSAEPMVSVVLCVTLGFPSPRYLIPPFLGLSISAKIHQVTPVCI